MMEMNGLGLYYNICANSSGLNNGSQKNTPIPVEETVVQTNEENKEE